jgi:hypothetical protein
MKVLIRSGIRSAASKQHFQFDCNAYTPGEKSVKMIRRCAHAYPSIEPNQIRHDFPGTIPTRGARGYAAGLRSSQNYSTTSYDLPETPVTQGSWPAKEARHLCLRVI